MIRPARSEHGKRFSIRDLPVKSTSHHHAAMRVSVPLQAVTMNLGVACPESDAW
jgi:hypothetical protein